MNSSLQELANKLNGVGNKTKKYVDRIYLFALFLFVAAQACSLTNNVADYVFVLLDISSLMLVLVGIYRIIFTLCSNWKKALILIAVVAFGMFYTLNTDETLPFSPVAFAIIGAVGVSADYVLFSGICGNLVMIATNIIITLKGNAGLFLNRYQDRDFFYLKNDVFYVSKWNNCSSTDLAAHYFWIIAAYLWIRGKKLTWGEFFALSALNALVYSLSGSSTSLLCISLILFCSFILKMLPKIKALFGFDDVNCGVSKYGFINKTVKFFRAVLSFCTRYSFLIFAAVCIYFAAVYNIADPLSNKLNNVLHYRLGLGHRGIIEYGVHLIADNVPSYGMYSSADGFYNFLDCSYISILIKRGILLFVFYMFSMTAIQLKQKKYLYGLIILAVCALACIEEHHLSELPYNLFLLLLLADVNADKKTADLTVKKNVSYRINIAASFMCLLFAVAIFFVNLPRFKAVKEIDRVDGVADSIYYSVQNNLDTLKADGTWLQVTGDMDSSEYGSILSHPSDYEGKYGIYWSEATKDPKVHSYYSICYSAENSIVTGGIIELMIDDNVKSIIGNGSAVIEYDVVTGTVYSVWYSETSECNVSSDGRNKDRAYRLYDYEHPLGYSTGD